MEEQFNTFILVTRNLGQNLDIAFTSKKFVLHVETTTDFDQFVSVNWKNLPSRETDHRLPALT